MANFVKAYPVSNTFFIPQYISDMVVGMIRSLCFWCYLSQIVPFGHMLMAHLNRVGLYLRGLSD
jgi:hypothetical protein